MPTQRIAFKDWLPDQPSILDSVSEANNVIPLAVGYGPFKSAVTYSGAASENLNNCFAAKLDNDVFIFAGGATKLFRVDNDDLSLVDESKAGGYTGLNRWQFLQFGSLALASNGSEKIQSFDVNSSTAFADVSSDAPIAKYITAVRDFVVAGNIGAGNVNATTFAGNLSGNVTGTILTAAQTSITSLGTLSSLGVSGTITAANITANTGSFTGNGAGLTTLNGSNISSGTVAQARLANSTLTLGNTTLTLGATTTTVTGLTGVTATTFTGSLSGAATTAGTVTTAAQPNITSVGTLTGLTVSATITGSVSGTAGTVTTAAQPNITSVGTLTSLSVTGNISAGNLTCSSGTVTAQTLTETSSMALKENFRPIENPLDVVLKLVGHIYDRKDGTTKGEAGLVAEQVAEILPNLVGLDSEGNPDSVKYSRLTVYLLESIKVLKDEIDSLKGNKRKTKK